MNIEYTYTSLKKAQDWANLNENSAKKLIRRAAVNGQDISTLPVKERKFCETQLSNDNRKALVYSGFGFVFTTDNYCVNMFKLPKWFGKKALYFDGQTKIKNPKKYIKYNLAL